MIPTLWDELSNSKIYHIFPLTIRRRRGGLQEYLKKRDGSADVLGLEPPGKVCLLRRENV